MNDFSIAVKGTQDFMGKQIPVVEGGFWAGQRIICDKTAAAIHKMPDREIRRRVTENIKRFSEGIDFIDLKRENAVHTLKETLQNIGYSQQSLTQAEHIYILSERGYLKLVKILDSDTAWDVYERMLDSYFRAMSGKNQSVKPMTELEILAASTQALVDHERKLKAHEDQLAAIEAHQDDADKRLDTVEQKIVKAAEAFKAPSFHPDTWQKDTNESINQIVQSNGLNHQKYRESLYSRLESIAGVNLRKRQTRAKTRMAEAGSTKTQLAEVSKLSIVARDKKLRVIFDGILREERAHNIVVA